MMQVFSVCSWPAEARHGLGMEGALVGAGLGGGRRSSSKCPYLSSPRTSMAVTRVGAVQRA